MKRAPWLLALLALSLAAACAGGKGASVTPSGSSSLGANLVRVGFSIAIPRVVASAKRAAKGSRKPQFVSPYVTSISIAVNGGAAQTFACSPPTCTGTFLAPGGQTDTIAIAALNASGIADSAATVSQFINANGVNTIDATLLGVVNFISLNPTPPGLPANASGTSQLTLQGFDADEDAIPGSFFTPVTLSLNDTTGTVAFTGPTTFATNGTTTITYTMNAASVNVDNHLTITAGGTTSPFSEPFEVGRTLYTFLSSGGVVGFNPGASSASRTVAAPVFGSVDMLACDGTNVYINDPSDGYTYTLAPNATTLGALESVEAATWLAAGTFGTQSVLYVGNLIGGAYGLQGPSGSPVAPVTDSILWIGAGGYTERATALDAAGNVWAAIGSSGGPNGGFVEYPGSAGPTPSTLSTTSRTGATTGLSSVAIAIDTGTSPTTVYTGDILSNGMYEIFEFDSASTTTPTATSTDTIDGVVLTDAAGRVYTHHAAAVWNVYARHALGTPLYSIPATSIAIDSQGYVWALSSNQITEYAPGGTTVIASIPGTYATPATPQFGTFCQAATATPAPTPTPTPPPP